MYGDWLAFPPHLLLLPPVSKSSDEAGVKNFCGGAAENCRKANAKAAGRSALRVTVELTRRADSF